MMDFGIFLGFYERDFCSCGRQRNGCFQKFACAELNLFWFLLIVVYLNIEEFDCWWGDWTERFLSQIKTLLFELFCKCSTVLKNFFLNVGRANQELELGKQTGDFHNLRDFSLESLENTASRGSIVGEVEERDYCLIYLWLEIFSCQQLQYVELMMLNLCL